jgi:hypothetical protein
MKTTERIVRLNDDTWLYEITTEDPVILTRPFTVRYPMRNDPSYLTPEYACHEDNTIVRNYTQTSRHERAYPSPEAVQLPVEFAAGIADTLAGRWVGRPRIATIDVDIELEFTKNTNGTVQGKLIGTNLGKIDKPLRNLSTCRAPAVTPPVPPCFGNVNERQVNFELPNVDPWRFSGEVMADGTIVGIVASAQGGLPVTFRRASASAR